MKFRLRFPQQEMAHWASRYDVPYDSEIPELGARAKKRGYFTKPEFLQLAYWKTPRSQPRCARNPDSLVEEATRIALSTGDERLRIEVLTLLEGVSYPTASVMLHFAHPAPYPIIDYRALWSLGVDEAPAYTFDFWWGYVEVCRELVSANELPMRAVDRALWQYSKENQP